MSQGIKCRCPQQLFRLLHNHFLGSGSFAEVYQDCQIPAEKISRGFNCRDVKVVFDRCCVRLLHGGVCAWGG